MRRLIIKNPWEYSSSDFRREAGEDLRGLWESVSTGLGILIGGFFSLFPAVVEIGIGAVVAILIGFLIPGGG